MPEVENEEEAESQRKFNEEIKKLDRALEICLNHVLEDKQKKLNELNFPTNNRAVEEKIALMKQKHLGEIDEIQELLED